MRCKTCDYPLWTIEARTCPECGSAFRPSDFEFRPGAVAFQCVHCRQSYFGTAETGHLIPREFDCVSCGKHIAMDKMVLVPAPGFSDESASTPPNPWVQRGRIGFWRAWFRSVLGVLTKPAAFAKTLANEKGLGGSLSFLLVTTCLSAAIGIVIQLLVMVPMLLFTRAGGGGAPPFSLGMLIGQQALFVLLGIVVGVVLSCLSALVSHLILWVLGGARESWRTTLRTLLYALGGTSAINMIACVPCIGVIGAVWWVVSASIMLREAQRTSTGKAVTAVLLPVLAMFLLVFGFMVAGIFMVRGAVAAAQARAAMAPNPITTVAASRGAWPRTPLDAVLDGAMPATTLLDFVADDDPDVRVEGLTLEDYAGSDLEAVRQAADRLAVRVPSAGAYRLGKLAVVWGGVPPDDPTAWFMVARRSDGTYTILRAGPVGEHWLIPSDVYESLREAENHRRRALGQPEIPPFDEIPEVPLDP